ncbi:hypothetical protein SAMN04487761_12034 [Lachnospiraceae bacterium C7]|nr:hypothetical protein SAMN04487761_12034 [Lachnospiraceae bacterium C7]
METRQYWVDTMLKIADPVLTSLKDEKLHENLPMNFHPDRKMFAHLEAVGRTLQGMAPWLEMEGLDEEEAKLQDKYRKIAREGLSNACRLDSKDYLNFSEGYGQALVDVAFLAHAIVRAPKQLFFKLDEESKKNLVEALKLTRKFKPFECNWLFFSAMIETALYVCKEDYNMETIDYAIQKFVGWYVGDGTYGDGEFFHWDYYDSFVIHPMYTDILRVMRNEKSEYNQIYESQLKRHKRYARIQEELINADGSYPVIGRSTTYRFGAFHALAQAVLMENLPEEVSNASVRCGLTAVIKKVLSYKCFDENGWLLPGICGNQPDMAEDYICVGSLYLCTAVFLPLGLPKTHPFWSDEDEEWTSKKIWSGANIKCDHATD